jgi:nucleoside-diphosphate-sugar epimerase
MIRLVTGGTGFVGRHLLRELAKRDGETFVLVRPGSRERLESLIESLGAGDRLRALEGDITALDLGIAARQASLQGADIYHLAAVYDLEAPEDDNEQRVGGTQNVVELAKKVGARLHRQLGAVAGSRWKASSPGDVCQVKPLGHPYYRTKYEAERIVRGQVYVSASTGPALCRLL